MTTESNSHNKNKPLLLIFLVGGISGGIFNWLAIPTKGVGERIMFVCFGVLEGIVFGALLYFFPRVVIGGLIGAVVAAIADWFLRTIVGALPIRLGLMIVIILIGFGLGLKSHLEKELKGEMRR